MRAPKPHLPASRRRERPSFDGATFSGAQQGHAVLAERRLRLLAAARSSMSCSWSDASHAARHLDRTDARHDTREPTLTGGSRVDQVAFLAGALGSAAFEFSAARRTSQAAFLRARRRRSRRRARGS